MKTMKMKKKQFILAMAFILMNAYTPNSFGEEEKCKKGTTLFSDGGSGANAQDPNKDTFPGTGNFKSCQRYADQAWNYNDGELLSFNNGWSEEYHKACGEENTKITDEKKEKLKAGAKKLAQKLLRCQALYLTMKVQGVDYNDEDHRNASMLNVGSFDQRGAPQPGQPMNPLGIPGIKCTGRGFETMDFPACMALANWLDGFFVAKTGMDSYHTIDYVTNAQNSALDIKPNDLAGGLKAQKSSVDKMAGQAGQKAALDAASAGTLFTLINSMPENTDIRAACANENSKKLLQTYTETLKEKYGQFISSNDDSELDFEELNNIDTLCDNISKNKYFSITENEQSRKTAQLAATKAGMEAAINVGKMALLNERSGKIDEAIESVESFKPVDFGLQYEAAITDFCQTNPTDPRCLEATPFVATENGQSAGTTTLIGGGAGAQAATTQGATVGDDFASVDGSDVGSTFFDGFGTGLEGVERDTGLEDSIAAATVSQAPPGQGAGAGSGGGGAGGGVSAPKGDPGLGSTPGAKGATAARAARVGFSKGGKGKLFFGGGRSRGSKSKGNPFNIKNQFKKILGESVDIGRDIASEGISGKGAHIFKRVSHQHTEALKKGRLHKYSLK